MGIPGRLSREPSLADAELKLAGVGLVGNYGLSIAFESGHSTGIYTYTRLRASSDAP